MRVDSQPLWSTSLPQIIRVSVFQDEKQLLSGLNDFTSQTINGDRHYLTAYNGEVWNGGFDLPFVRSACVRRDVDWPFAEVAYAE